MPDNRPEPESNVAQLGRLLMLKVSGLLSGSDAEGVKEYDCPATTEVAGVPEIVGARFPTSTTTENGPIDELSTPSVALTVILL